MAVYRFPQFNVDLVDPIMEVVMATYQIGGEPGAVSVVLSTDSERLIGETFDGFPNDGEWSDADVMAWAVLELEKHRVEIP